MEELCTLAGEAMVRSAENLLDVVGRAHATDLLSRWEGFGRFCREVLGLEPVVLMRAFGLGVATWGQRSGRRGPMQRAARPQP
ncbi:MAG TPA: hypothetical protein VGI81_02520, partial [Tepidisphaeraceae bacterium]